MTTAVATLPDLKPQLALLAVTGSKALADIFDQLAMIEQTVETLPVSTMPAPLELPADLANALKRVPDVFNSVSPASRRALNAKELESLAEEKKTLDIVMKALKLRSDAITEMASTHFDVSAERASVVSETSERDAKGHYRIARPGSREEHLLRSGEAMWCREGTADKSVPSQHLLDIAVQEGRVSQKVYNQITKVSRQLDEGLITAALCDPKARTGVIRALAQCTVVSKGNNKIVLRPMKK